MCFAKRYPQKAYWRCRLTKCIEENRALQTQEVLARTWCQWLPKVTANTQLNTFRQLASSGSFLSQCVSPISILRLLEDADWWNTFRLAFVVTSSNHWCHAQGGTFCIWSACRLRWERSSMTSFNWLYIFSVLMDSNTCKCYKFCFQLDFYGNKQYYTMSISPVWYLLWAVEVYTGQPLLGIQWEERVPRVLEFLLLSYKAPIDLPGFRGQHFLVSEHFSRYMVAPAAGFKWKIVTRIPSIQVLGNHQLFAMDFSLSVDYCIWLLNTHFVLNL